jgi:hypothetical protein
MHYGTGRGGFVSASAAALEHGRFDGSAANNVHWTWMSVF